MAAVKGKMIGFFCRPEACLSDWLVFFRLIDFLSGYQIQQSRSFLKNWSSRYCFYLHPRKKKVWDRIRCDWRPLFSFSSLILYNFVLDRCGRLSFQTRIDWAGPTHHNTALPEYNTEYSSINIVFLRIIHNPAIFDIHIHIPTENWKEIHISTLYHKQDARTKSSKTENFECFFIVLFQYKESILGYSRI